MRNKTILSNLSRLNPQLKVSIKAILSNGCEETGRGTGKHEGVRYLQEYSIIWNDGYLCASSQIGYTIAYVIKILVEKSLSQIGNDDFNLRPGELINGFDPEYETTWEDEEPEEKPEDRELYWKMSTDNTVYIWDNASSIEFEVHKSKNGESILFVLDEDD